MKNHYLFLFFFLSVLSLQGQSKKEKELFKKEVSRTLDQWHQYAAESDFEGYFALLDKDAVFIGTDSSEVWTKKEFMQYAKKPFKEKKGWKFVSTARNIYLGNNPDIAWFDELLDTWMGQCRGSGVLVRKDGEWRVKHYILSLTVPNDKLKMVKKIIAY